ncbi:hypothetical protein KIF24_08940 [Micromonospora sp. Llam7]|uniref:hypothetical protein n=1 Tax=Micromonospora tarapacensis TaxID=2835305 RepID=UPI001C83B032|nr:hypothetical protein [Micromonospora tarapacensis]MBX7266134.1 hypothetical protein [Micromonospora tarapacensis]
MPALSRLTVLLCDSGVAAGRLYQELTGSPLVERVVVAASLDEAIRGTADNAFDVVIVDPLSTGLARTGELALGWSAAGMAVVLHVDQAVVEEQASVFYRGERVGLKELYTLDKRTPAQMLAAEAEAMLIKCREFRLLATGRSRTDRLLDRMRDMAADSGDDNLEQLVEDVDETRSLERARTGVVRPAVARGSVFLSYRFEEEDGYVRGLTGLLEDQGFTVVTGRGADGYVGAAVLNRIRGCEFFVSLMTRARPFAGAGQKYATSAWLIEEKGAALAYRKYLVLLVEEGVDDIGGLQGDWQRHVFTPTTFTTAARAAVAQLRHRSGRPDAVDDDHQSR